MKSFMYVVLLALAIGLGGCRSESTTPSAIADPGELPADNVIYGLRHVMTKDGVRTGNLHGDTAYVFERDRRLDIVGVRLVFFGESGEQTGTLTSATGEYQIATGSFVARGNVVLITQEEGGTRRLETEELHYDVREDQLWSDVPFVMIHAGRTTRGTSFRSDSGFDNWSVTEARTAGGAADGGRGISF